MSASRFAIAIGITVVSTTFALLIARGESAQEPSTAVSAMLAHVATDKPIYRGGEPVYVRCTLLGTNDHKPIDAQPGMQPMAMVQITGPRGETLSSQYTQAQDSVAGLSWPVPADAAGGQYTVKVSFPRDGYPTTERKFEVRAYRAPRLKGEIIFLRDGFGPGDMVKASLHVERAEGEIPAGAAVSANAIIDGQNAFQGSTTIDNAGNCSVNFKLPGQMEKGDGTLSLAITDGGVVEPISKTIPILLRTLDVSFYPEGGDLVAGLPCRIYLEARTPSQKPADLVGDIVDSSGKSVATVKTEHEGRGRFIFTPAADQTYSLKLSQPAGIEKTFPLPAIAAKGVCLSSDQDVWNSEPVSLHLSATEAGSYSVILSKHQSEISSLQVKVGAGESKAIQLTPPGWADGVLVATIKDHSGTPLAERLIFRKPARSLHVKVTADKSVYIPAAPANFTVTTTDDDGKPVGAVVGITATDQSILQIIEKRDYAPRLGAMVLLEDDVKELADAQIYLDSADPKAALATDLLLGTQGWRRFATIDQVKFLASFGDQGRRALANREAAMPELFGMTHGIRMVGGEAINAEMAVAAAAPRADIKKMADGHASKGTLQLRIAAADGRSAAKQPPIDQLAASQPMAMKGMAQLDREDFFGQAPPAQTIRVYAHDLQTNHQPGDRTDFTETLYWSAAVKTDPKTGTAGVSFKMNDSVTSFKVSADGFDSTGALGEGSTTVASVQPFYVEPKLPLEVSSGDLIKLPVAAVNGTDHELSHVGVTFTAAKGIDIAQVSPFKLAAGGRERQMTDIKIGSALGAGEFVIKADAGDFKDTVTRTLLVKPLGFPMEIANGGLIDPNSTIKHTIEIPASVIPGSVTTKVALYPTPMGNMTEALQRLLQEPNGCFEQTTSTNYPLVMADQYFLTHTGVDPTLIARSNELLAKGYDRLRSFECKNKGYEWFGEDPGHECLSAYGLLEFTDMAAVREVDPAMLANTRAWLLTRRDGKGGFSHERRALHTWISDPGCSNGYCTWALLECGEKGLDKEVGWLKDRAGTDGNSYVTALAANALFLAGEKEAAKSNMTKLASKQIADGHVDGAITTVVGSGGESLQVETTALATLAWLRDPAFAGNVEKGVHFLADSCKAGRYGSTQSTVLALRAIVAYDKARAHPTAAGKVQLLVDGKPCSDAMAFDANTHGALMLPDMTSLMTPGSHAVELKMSDGSTLPYAVSVSFNSVTPSSSEQCKLAITTSVANSQASEGQATEVLVTVTNRTSETLPTPVAIVGLPGGLEIRHQQLKELVKAGRIAAYEVRGREVILYWRDMQPNEKIKLPLSAVAAVPGTYTGPASRVYLYYTDEDKQWAEGMKITIAPKGS